MIRLFLAKYAKVVFFPLLVCIVGFNYHTQKHLTVVIDAAHGGTDTGAVYDTLVEKKIVLNIVNELRNIEATNVEFIFLRNTDRYIPTNQRLEFIEQMQPDLVVSIHLGNAGDATTKGIVAHINQNEVYDESMLYAQKLLASLRNVNPVTCTQINKSDYYYLQKLNQTPAIILELGYLSNAEDRKFIQGENFEYAMAESLAEAF